MEGNLKLEQVDLMSDLMEGKELAKELYDNMLSSSLSLETKGVLLEKILLTYEKVFTKLGNVGETNKITNGNMVDSPCSFTNDSNKSEVLDLDQDVKHKNVSKKRKTMCSWTKKVKVCSGTTLEVSLNDGCSWRKYGQKDILGAKFPRGYYRCTHRHAQGCLATKQVQKSDEDPTTYEITYKGRHTCNQASHVNKACSLESKICLGENKHQKNEAQGKKIEQPQETMFTFGSELEVKEEDLETKKDIFPSFCFPSPSIGTENENNDNNNIFSDTMIENHFLGSFSPSESNIFCFSPCQFGSSSGLGLSVQTSESDITDIVSATTPTSNSPIVNLDELDLFFDNNVDFDTDFLINTSEFFS
ncbi:hypothetical protein RIF29_16455 [Crotalaria pallida]|uniref:WRKY domain-containing protein n=1 Tax=Crotalaria pallida TaxID=3830 RepID=A0AAN9FFE2_CROPI